MRQRGGVSSKANTATLSRTTTSVTTGKRRVGTSSYSGIKADRAAGACQAVTRQAHTLNSGILATGSRALLVSLLAGDSQKWKGTNTVPGRTRVATLAGMLMTPRRVSTLTAARRQQHSGRRHLARAPGH